MCEYQIFKDNDLSVSNSIDMPICAYTKEMCTLCVLGNSKTYNEAESKEICNKED